MTDMKKLRIGILGSFTLNGIDEMFKEICLDKNIDCETYTCGYNQYNQDILNKDSSYYKFKPELTFLVLDVRHILGDLFFDSYKITSFERSEFIEKKVDDVFKLLKTIVTNSDSKIVLSNFQYPTYSPYGINDGKKELGLKEIIENINIKIRDRIKKEKSIFIFDFNGFVTKYGEVNVFNFQQYFSGDIKISIRYTKEFVNELMQFVVAHLGITKKCIVLDLDNTLWGGIIGEDGFESIKLGDEPIGRSFVEFQKRLLALSNRGIILAINSRNNFEDAIRVIREHPNMILKENDFSCVKINWKNKALNLREISKELNIGLDSIVFFDDDPINRELVKKEMPEVSVIDLHSDSSEFANKLTRMIEFEIWNMTSEDIQKKKMYGEQKQRIEYEEKIDDYDEFLRNMDIQIEIKEADDFTIPRISQLTLKTNQFNVTTRRYQEKEIFSFSQDKNSVIQCAKVKDKFGDNGITGVYIVKKEEKEWIIDTFLLSCRIIGRGVEDALLSEIIKRAKKEGVKKVKGVFIPTKKNKPAEKFFEEFGFKKENEYWVFDTEQTIKSADHIKIIKNE